MNRKRLASAVILVTALQSHWALGLGLGEIRLSSALNQPMRAEIPLRDVGDLTAEQIIVKLASEEDFARSGSERSYYMTRFTFEIQVDGRGSGKVIVSSRDPVVEPFVDLVVETRWPNGRLLKNYTMLLDLPVFGQSAPAPRVRPQPLPSQSAASAPSRSVTREPTSRPQIRRTPGPAAQRAASAKAQSNRRVVAVVQDKPKIRSIADAPPSNRNVGVRPSNQKYNLPVESGSERYRTQHYDTLSGVAGRLAENSGVSTRQMMLALQRLNPEAFSRDNINNLKSGYVLRVPSEDEARRYSEDEAAAEVARQNRAWRGESVEPSALPSRQLNATASTVEDDNEVAYEEAEARLSIAAGGIAEAEGRGDGSSKKGSASVDDSLFAEELSRQEEENKDLKARIANLEEQLATLQRMLEIRSDSLAGMQAGASKPKPALAQAFDGNELDAALNDDTYNEPVAEDDLEFDADAADAELAATLQNSDASGQREQSPAANDAEPEKAEGWKGYLQQAQGYYQEAKTTAESVVGDTDPGLLRNIGFGILLLVLLLVLLLRRGKNKPVEEDEELELEMAQGLVAGGAAAGGVVTGVTAGSASAALDAEKLADASQSDDSTIQEADPSIVDGVDDGDALAASLQADETEQAAVSGVSTNDSSQAAPANSQTGDVVAESEIYLAYGRHDDAVNLLEAAQADDPNNSAITAKLAEAYAAAGKQEQLGSLLGTLDPINDAETIEQVKGSLPDDPESRAWLEKLAASAAIVTGGAAAKNALGDDLDISIDDSDEIDLDLDDIDFDDIDLDAETDTADSLAAESTDDLEIELQDDADSNDLDYSLEDTDFDEDVKIEAAPKDDLGMDSAQLAKELSLDQDSLNAEMEDLDDAAVGAAMGDLNMDDLLKDEIAATSGEPSAEAIAETENQLDMIAQGDELGVEMLTEDFDDTLDLDVDSLNLDDIELDGDELELELDDDTLSVLESIDDDAKGSSADKTDSPLNLELSDVDAESLADFSFDDESISLEIDDPLDLELDDVTPSASTTSGADSDVDFELPDISDFDADSFDSEETEVKGSADVSMLSHDDEAGTKLDLARAYIDMGDPNAAKDLLDEVLADGSAAQQSDARELIDRL